MHPVRFVAPKFDHGKTFFSGTIASSRRRASRQSGSRSQLVPLNHHEKGERMGSHTTPVRDEVPGETARKRPKIQIRQLLSDTRLHLRKIACSAEISA